MRIFANRISKILPKIIGDHQYGFMKNRGIQQPLLIANQTIQTANTEKHALQIISFDIEKAFDKTSHQIILQALNKFGFPQIIIDSINSFALSGLGKVEVNGKLSIEFKIKTGSGQGDPISSILFLISSEPLNVCMNQIHQNKFYTVPKVQKGMILFADDNLARLQLQKTET